MKLVTKLIMVITQNHGVLNETGMCRRNLAKIPDVNFDASLPSGSRDIPCNFIKVPKNEIILYYFNHSRYRTTLGWVLSPRYCASPGC